MIMRGYRQAIKTIGIKARNEAIEAIRASNQKGHERTDRDQRHH